MWGWQMLGLQWENIEGSVGHFDANVSEQSVFWELNLVETPLEGG